MYKTEISNDNQNRLDLLIQHAKHNQAEAQQLALDASRLLAISSERFDEFKDKGFFKRCWYKISGKHGELLRANQADLIEMQKFSWYYLMKLQEQNLIEAQSIAVIRNNLQELQVTTLETRVAIVRLVEKFDHRIVKLEEVYAIHDWLISIKVKGYDRYPELHRMLKVVFDYFKIIQEKGIAYERIEGRNDIEAALHDLSVNYNRELTLAEFVTQLVDEITQIEFNQFRELIQLRVSGNSVDSAFILENVSASGYCSIYIIEKELLGIQNVVKYIEDIEYQKIIMRKSLHSKILDPDKKYSLINLAKEILACCTISDKIYRENYKTTVQEYMTPKLFPNSLIESTIKQSTLVNNQRLAGKNEKYKSKINGLKKDYRYRQGDEQELEKLLNEIVGREIKELQKKVDECKDEFSIILTISKLIIPENRGKLSPGTLLKRLYIEEKIRLLKWYLEE